MPVTKRTRYEVLKRDNFTCRYCRSSEGELTVDHVTPRALGGSDDPTNLVAACRDCNAGKSSTSPTDDIVADVAGDLLRWGQAIKEWNRIQKGSKKARAKWVSAFDAEWTKWGYGFRQIEYPRPSDWRESARQFFATGLPIEEAIEAIEIACGSTRVNPDGAWRYCCGVIWKKVEQMTTGARDLLAKEDADGA